MLILVQNMPHFSYLRQDKDFSPPSQIIDLVD